MAELVTKILIRQGTNSQRATAEGTGVKLNSGELGFCIDTKRVFVGDGVTYGGWAVGVQNLGRVEQLLDENTGNFTAEAQAVIDSKGASVGDFIYDGKTRLIWSFATASYPPTPSDLITYDTGILYSPDNFSLNQAGQLQIKEGGVYSSNLYPDVVDNITLTKPSYAQPISIREQAVANKYLATMPSNSVKVNRNGYQDVPADLELDVNTVVGRRNGNVEAIPTGDLLGSAIVAGAGILLDSVGAKVRINLDGNYIDATGEQITLNKPTTIRGQTGVEGPFSVFDDASVQGTLRVGQDVIAFTSSDLRMKTDLTVIDDAIDKVERLAGYEFTYGSNAPQELQGVRTYGVLAQDLQRVLPNAVFERTPSEDGVSYKAVDYDKIIPLLIEAIKALNNKIEHSKKGCCHNK